MFTWTLFALILKGAKSSDQDFETVNCHSELIDKDSLQYRVWCDSQQSHKCCRIQEMCWKNYDTTYVSEKILENDLFKLGGLAQFDFDENTTETNTLESCEILVTVLGTQ